MKITISKNELQRGLTRIQSIVEKRNTMPILANVLMTAPADGSEGSLELAATDLEVGIRSLLAAEVEAPGRVTASAKKLYEIIRELPDEPVHINVEENSYLTITCARAHFTLAGASAEEYPSLPAFSPKRLGSLPAVVLAQMIDRTMYAASLDESRYNLNGVYLEPLESSDTVRMVATDGHRLAYVDRPIGEALAGLEQGVIIPRKGLAELRRLVEEDDADEIEVAFDGSHGLTRKGAVTLVMRLIEGEFPNYRQVVPSQGDIRLSLATEPFLHSLRRVSLLSNERSRTVKIQLSKGLMVLSSSNPDLGDAREELDVDYEGDDLEVAFNARYLTDALGALDAKEVQLELKDALSAVRILPPGDQESLAVVMPMRV